MISNQYPSIAERRRLGIYVPHLEVGLTERFGEDVARLILERFGGTSVFIALKARGASPIIEEFGLAVYRWLFEHHGTGALEIPRGPTSPHVATTIRIRRLILDTDLSNADIARLTRCHARSVRRHLNAMREAGISLPHRPVHPQASHPQSKEKITK